MTTGSGKRRVADYYESPLSVLWAHLARGQMHLGYWDETEPGADFACGVVRLTEEMIAMADIGPGQRFLDVGCGLGMPACALARARKCSVDGVNVSLVQCRGARENAKRLGVSGLVRFHAADALKLPFADESFDGGWFFESIFHMGHALALAEARRVLRPGAQLLLADAVDLGTMDEDLRRMAREVGNVHYLPREGYEEMLAESGFRCLELRDVTAQVLGPLQEKFDAAFMAEREELLKLATEEELGSFERATELLVQTVGYILVRAERV